MRNLLLREKSSNRSIKHESKEMATFLTPLRVNNGLSKFSNKKNHKA